MRKNTIDKNESSHLRQYIIQYHQILSNITARYRENDDIVSHMSWLSLKLIIILQNRTTERYPWISPFLVNMLTQKTNIFDRWVKRFVKLNVLQKSPKSVISTLCYALLLYLSPYSKALDLITKQMASKLNELSPPESLILALILLLSSASDELDSNDLWNLFSRLGETTKLTMLPEKAIEHACNPQIICQFVWHEELDVPNEHQITTMVGKAAYLFSTYNKFVTQRSSNENVSSNIESRKSSGKRTTEIEPHYDVAVVICKDRPKQQNI